MVRVDWIYRADGGSDAFLCDKHIAILQQDGDAFTITWCRTGMVHRFSCSRYARESVFAAAHEVPWDENGKPEIAADD